MGKNNKQMTVNQMRTVAARWPVVLIFHMFGGVAKGILPKNFSKHDLLMQSPGITLIVFLLIFYFIMFLIFCGRFLDTI